MMRTRTVGNNAVLPGGHAEASATSEPITLGARLMTLSNLMRRITTHRFQRLYDLTLVEGWIVSHLGGGGAMSLDSLAHRAGLTKSQMSRGVTQMVRRLIVDRRRNPTIHNEVILTLTPLGQEIYEDIKGNWPSYNKLLLTGISEAEQTLLLEIVTQLIDNSRRNLAQEHGESDATSATTTEEPSMDKRGGSRRVRKNS